MNRCIPVGVIVLYKQTLTIIAYLRRHGKALCYLCIHVYSRTDNTNNQSRYPFEEYEYYAARFEVALKCAFKCHLSVRVVQLDSMRNIQVCIHRDISMYNKHMWVFVLMC